MLRRLRVLGGRHGVLLSRGVPWAPQRHALALMQSKVAAYATEAPSFASMGLNPLLQAALAEQHIDTPTQIQTSVIPAILARQDVLCLAQTGTGKTLAYLLPLIEQFQRQEAKLKNQRERQRQQTTSNDSTSNASTPNDTNTSNDTKTSDKTNTNATTNNLVHPRLSARPSVLVLTPTRELALQVGHVAKQLAHVSKFSTAVITSAQHKRAQQTMLDRPLDVVIATPGRLAKCIARKELFVSHINALVLDEADTLLDPTMGFRTELEAVLKPLEDSALARDVGLQVVLVAATVAPPIQKAIQKRFGDGLLSIRDTHVHTPPTTLHEDFVHTSPERKHAVLRQVLATHSKYGKSEVKRGKTLIFCRNAASCRAADHMLHEHGIKSFCLHGEMPPNVRTASFAEFKATEDEAAVLVCTDIAARGLDLENIEHIVMLDFPASAVEYLHRAGRAGRNGAQGFVTSLVTKHDMRVAKQIEAASGQNQKQQYRSKGSEARRIRIVDDKDDIKDKHENKTSMRIERTATRAPSTREPRQRRTQTKSTNRLSRKDPFPRRKQERNVEWRVNEDEEPNIKNAYAAMEQKPVLEMDRSKRGGHGVRVLKAHQRQKLRGFGTKRLRRHQLRTVKQKGK